MQGLFDLVPTQHSPASVARILNNENQYWKQKLGVSVRKTSVPIS